MSLSFTKLFAMIHLKHLVRVQKQWLLFRCFVNYFLYLDIVSQSWYSLVELMRFLQNHRLQSF